MSRVDRCRAKSDCLRNVLNQDKKIEDELCLRGRLTRLEDEDELSLVVVEGEVLVPKQLAKKALVLQF